MDPVHGETSPHLLLEAQDQPMGARQAQLPCKPTGTSFGSVKKRKLAWFGDVTLRDSFFKTILQGTAEGG